MRKQGSFVNITLHILAFLLSVAPAAVCTLAYFPLWSEGASHSISGIAALLLVLAFMPLCKAVQKMLSTPSVTTVWLLLFILFFALSKIAYEMTVISFVGLVSNFIASILFRIARKEGKSRE